MPELRKDYILDRYVIIAKERAKRPEQFISDKDNDNSDPKDCFFCPGNEHTTPPEICRTEKDGRWQIRVFDNKFSAVAKEGNTAFQTHNDFFTFADSVGRHEVIVETPSHEKQLWDLGDDRIRDVLEMYRRRIQEIRKVPGVRYVQVFKNHKREAGTSLKHSHSQVVGYNLVPTIIRVKEDAVAKHEECPYCRIFRIESGSDRRIAENDSATCFCPYASASPFEAWIFPKRHMLSIEDMDDKELSDMAALLGRILRKLKKLNAAYNFYLHYGVEKMHFHIVVVPRITLLAGFEYGTETVINIMPPEQAAEFYRND